MKFFQIICESKLVASFFLSDRPRQFYSRNIKSKGAIDLNGELIFGF